LAGCELPGVVNKRMNAFERKDEGTNGERREVTDQSPESLLGVENELYEDESLKLQKKLSRYQNLSDLAYTLAAPGGLYIISKFVGVDFHQMGIDFSNHGDDLIRSSWWFLGSGAVLADLGASNINKRLSQLKEKFDALDKSQTHG
jgi:hypothetical protein